MNFFKRLFVKKTVKDIDGNIYHTLIIGKQVWMVENLKVSKFRNGDNIPNITDDKTWANPSAETYYCCYDNDSSNADKYGLLYNWHTVNDSRKICPKGWHVPMMKEWNVLKKYLGSERSVVFDKMKEVGTIHWEDSNSSTTNSSGFTALPGGLRNSDGLFKDIGTKSCWWTASEYDTKFAYPARISDSDNFDLINKRYSKKSGFSVRCIKD